MANELFVSGQTVKFTASFYDAGGTLINPDTVTFRVRQPDATTTTYTYAGGSVTRDSTGVYSVVLTLAAVDSLQDVWFRRWASTGTYAQAFETSFRVLRSQF